MDKKLLDKTIHWRWEQLENNFEDSEEPSGLCENIDDAIFGKLNWNQRSLIKQPDLQWILKEKKN